MEQNSPEDIRGQVSNVVSCPLGNRVEQPEFGITPLQFQNAPLRLDILTEQVAKWVGDTTYQIIEEAISDEQERRTILEITP